MLGIYILAAMLGGGLLLFSILSGAHHGDGDLDVSGMDVDVDGDGDVGGFDHDLADVHAGQDLDAAHDAAGQLVLGLFRPRNIIYFLAAFGLTGVLLTWSGTAEDTTLGLSLAMGGGAMLLTHAIFTWLRRSESGLDALNEADVEGREGRVVLPLAPGQPGRVVCLISDRELYLTARLAPDVTRPLSAGAEVVVLRVERGVAEVIPFDMAELPPGES